MRGSSGWRGEGFLWGVEGRREEEEEEGSMRLSPRMAIFMARSTMSPMRLALSSPVKSTEAEWEG